MQPQCSVLVVGAGVAGVPAAVAAARAGADTVLVEQYAYPGGAGVAGLHRHLCGLYANGPAFSPQLLNGGLVSELCARLGVLAPAQQPQRLGRVDVLPYAPAQFEQTLRELLASEQRLRTSFNTTVLDAELAGRRILSVTTDHGVLRPRVVVDCSGAGVVLGSAPALHVIAPAHERQLAGGTVHFGNLQATDAPLVLRVPYELRQAAEAGRLPATLRFTSFAAGATPDEGWCKLSFPPAPLRDALAWPEAAQRLLEHLQKNIPAFQAARIMEVSPAILEREGARLHGLYTLTAEDVLGARKFPDAVARNAWPIELWDQQTGPRYRYLPAGAWYEIPLRCLQAVAADNLLAAGRCLSASREALGSTRVMGPCLALGAAAGAAAARLAAQMEADETLQHS